MHEVERQMAKLRAEAMVGAPITPSTTFGPGTRATPGSGGVPSQGQGPDADEVKQLKLELKERKRQMHKMQEVYGRLKEKFVAAGGAAAAFDAQRDVTGLQYELQFTETKRAAERKRAEMRKRVAAVQKKLEEDVKSMTEESQKRAELTTRDMVKAMKELRAKRARLSEFSGVRDDVRVRLENDDRTTARCGR